MLQNKNGQTGDTIRLRYYQIQSTCTFHAGDYEDGKNKRRYWMKYINFSMIKVDNPFYVYNHISSLYYSSRMKF